MFAYITEQGIRQLYKDASSKSLKQIIERAPGNCFGIIYLNTTMLLSLFC